MITLEGWSGVMYQIRMSRGGFSLEGDIFCVGCVIFGALFVLNLMIAVQFDFLNEAFDEIEDKQAKAKAEQEKEMKEDRLYEENEADITAFAPGEEMEDVNQTKLIKDLQRKAREREEKERKEKMLDNVPNAEEEKIDKYAAIEFNDQTKIIGIEWTYLKKFAMEDDYKKKSWAKTVPAEEKEQLQALIDAQQK